ncbi:hypothetical protein FRC91_13090 [Bradymonadales bacterium TMQ1]|nr:hypothetical protein FRC91_13090 [Bradymonadales bacterium TMQ1]
MNVTMMFGKIAGVCLVVFCVLVTGVGLATAQEQEPLRLGYINTAGNSGERSYESIEDALEESTQIELLDEGDVLARAQATGLELATFRQSALREENRAAFARLMSEGNIEGLLIHDVFGGGNTLQVVVLGPRGEELADVRYSIRRGRIDQDGVMQVLREVFSALVPEVLAYRDEQALERQRQLEEEEAARAAQTEAEVEPLAPEDDPRAAAVARHRQQYGNLSPHLKVRAGLMVGQRMMRQSNAEAFEINHNTPLFGGGARVDAMVAIFDGGRAALEVGGYFDFAPYTSQFADEALPGQYMRGGGQVRYVRGLGPSLKGRGLVGAELLSATLAPNALYTGHSYLSAQVGVGLGYAFGELAELNLAALFTPVISGTNSSGAYGEGSFAPSASAQVGLVVRSFEPFLIGVDYTYQLHLREFPEPAIVDGPVSSRDQFHTVLISAGYRFDFGG